MYTLSRECVGGCTRAPPGPEDDTMRQYRLRAPVPAASARAARWRGRGRARGDPANDSKRGLVVLVFNRGASALNATADTEPVVVLG